jgi:hypothetical protein
MLYSIIIIIIIIKSPNYQQSCTACEGRVCGAALTAMQQYIDQGQARSACM